MHLEFATETGIAVPAVTADQMREIDRIAVEETGPNLFQMMENAGRNLAILALRRLGSHWRQTSILILAGSGGNGGGGICAARHLANRGVDVAICLASPDRLSDVAAWQAKVFGSTPGRLVDLTNLKHERPEIILDALIGYSLNSAPRGTFAELIHWANGVRAPILSLDIPSGVSATTGETPGAYIRAVTTLTLALPKTGLLPEETGNLILADIGLPAQIYRRLGLNYAPPFAADYLVALRTRITGDPAEIES